MLRAQLSTRLLRIDYTTASEQLQSPLVQAIRRRLEHQHQACGQVVGLYQPPCPPATDMSNRLDSSAASGALLDSEDPPDLFICTIYERGRPGSRLAPSHGRTLLLKQAPSQPTQSSPNEHI